MSGQDFFRDTLSADAWIDNNAYGKDSPMPNLLLSVMGAFVEFERALIRERQLRGNRPIQEAGEPYKGRKKALNHEQAAEIKGRADTGEPRARIAGN